jgi:hypothetical protein
MFGTQTLVVAHGAGAGAAHPPHEEPQLSPQPPHEDAQPPHDEPQLSPHEEPQPVLQVSTARSSQ